MTLTEIKALLAAHGLRPLKQFGQNFLIDQNLCQWIAAQTGATSGGSVIEVGPGLGSLTEYLLATGLKVTALEVDQGLSNVLRTRFAKEPRFQLVEGDALETLPQQPPFEHLVGNLPYNISTPLIITMLSLARLPQTAVFTLQKETGERLAAEPNSAEYGAVTVFTQSFYTVELLRTLTGPVFYPQPDVDSIVVKLTLHEIPDLTLADRRPFYDFMRKAFGQRRKKLRNTLGVDSDLRPQQLGVADWIKLYKDSQKN